MTTPQEQEIKELVTVGFDGDYEKAVAIDTALTYFLFDRDRWSSLIAKQVAGVNPIEIGRFGLGYITSVFEAVLEQTGYVLYKISDLEQINESLEKLSKRAGRLGGIIEARDRMLDAREEEISSIRDLLAVAQARVAVLEEEQRESAPDVSNVPPDPEFVFRAAACDGRHPYRPDNGNPCVIPRHEETEHVDTTGARWWDDRGLNERRAKETQTLLFQAHEAENSGRPREFRRSSCTLMGPYNPNTAEPCTGGHTIGMAHEDATEGAWAKELGLNEAAARRIQQQ